MRKLFWIVLILSFLVIPFGTKARENVIDWYIKDFKTTITVNKDSTLDVTEDIIADCGKALNKHGIFRVLPTQVYKDKGKAIKTPIELVSITDFNGNPYKYSTTKNYKDHTLTWKIGDPNKTVQGENNYRIRYHVGNAIRFDSPSFDEFYWNLNGNFWELEIDKFSAEVIFPQDAATKETNLYAGKYGYSGNSLAKYQWDGNILKVDSLETLRAGDGITASVTFKKDFFTPYKFGFWEKYGGYLPWIFPIILLIFCLFLWARYGRDPKIRGPIVPEFGSPENLNPMELGSVISNGGLRSQYISAGIVNLAVKGFIKIEETKADNYKLNLVKSDFGKLNDGEKTLLEKLFGEKKEVAISSLKNNFYRDISDVEKSVNNPLEDKDWVKSSNSCLQIVFISLAVILFFTAVGVIEYSGNYAGSLAVMAAILIVFVFLIPKRTIEGAKMLKRIDGFKLYMETAEKYRQKFNEKENIFERFLPYAIVFGITGLWVKKMQEIYGKEYVASYHPIWYVGSLAAFNVNSLDSTISSISSNMSSTLSSTPSSSGSGGGGFSGGGGGGGGGGGW